MNRAILALFMTFALASAFAFKDNGSTSDGLFEFVDTSCKGAISGFNKGIQQLISNIQTQSNQWLVYSDLDALDGYAYHLQNLCDPNDYELTTQLQGGQTPAQQQACSNLLAMLGSILDQNQPLTFKNGYEQGLALSNQALTFGPNIANGCKISVVVNAEAQDKEDSSAEEENGAEEELGLNEENNEEADISDDSDGAGKDSDDSDASNVILAANLNVFAQKESDEDSDSDDTEDASDDSEDDSEDDDDDDDDDSDAKQGASSDDSEDDSDDNSDDDDDASDKDSSDDSSDAANEEEWAGEEWNNQESLATTKAWDSEEWAGEEWNNQESVATTKAWDIRKWAKKVAKIATKIAENNEEYAVTGWDNGDWSDFSHFGSNDNQYDSSDHHSKSTFFYEVNPNGNTDSGSDWLNGGFNRYIPGGSGAPTGNTGNAGIPSIPSIPGIGGNGGGKVTFLAAIGQQASGNPWMSGDYKRYYGGDSGNGGAPATKFLAIKQDDEPQDFYWTI